MRGAIFDLDGTLADTAEDLLAAANVALAPAGLPRLDPDRDRHIAGRGGREMIRRSLELQGRDANGAEEIALTDRLYPCLLEAYAHCLADRTRLFDGVETVLDQLDRTGWRLGVCTNKPEGLAVRLLHALGVAARFEVILGADSLPVRKPNPRHFTETARRAGADPRRSVMMGDTQTDLSAAEAAGAPCVLTTFGFSAAPVHEMGAHGVIEHFHALPELLETLVPAR